MYKSSVHFYLCLLNFNFVRIITAQGRIPVKWTAYEALLQGRYTTKSDVYVSKRVI